MNGAIAAMSQFGLKAKDLDSVLGSLNAVASKFAVESEDLISVIRRTGGVFKAVFPWHGCEDPSNQESLQRPGSNG